MRAPLRGSSGRRHDAAFTLVEVLIALLVLTLCLFLALGLHLQQRRILSRLAAQGEALRALEGTIEALRAGAIPLESETVPAPFATDAHGLVVTVVVTGTDVSALFDVKAEARFVVAGEPRRRGLETLIWAPPP
ncbi:MAG: prepilin-type N-terminal cleavage/methylation domain-containing protein [Acidobacteriota bacterium]